MKLIEFSELSDLGFYSTFIEDEIGDFDLDPMYDHLLSNYSVSAGLNEHCLIFCSLTSTSLGPSNDGVNFETGYYIWGFEDTFYLVKLKDQWKCELYSKNSISEVLDLMTTLMDKEPKEWKNWRGN